MAQQSLSAIYSALKKHGDRERFAKFCHWTYAGMQKRFLDADNMDVINAFFQAFAAQMYLEPKPKPKPRGAYVANRGRRGEINRLRSMFAAEADFWRGKHGD